MSESITNVEDAVAALGALPVPVGPKVQPVDIEDHREQAVAWEGHVLGAWDGEFAMETGLDRAVLKLARMVKADVAEVERLRAERAAIGNEVARFGIYGAALPATRALVKRADALVTENAELRSRIAELLTERHSTNEALDDAVQELRRRDDSGGAR